MLPFILIATRDDDAAADAEYESVLQLTGLEPEQLIRVRLERGPFPDIDLSAVSGIIVGGSPFTTSDPEESKSGAQVAAEAEIARLLDAVIEQDIPFFGACYGVGSLGRHQGAVIDARYGEPVGAVCVTLTADAATDPVIQAAKLPEVFPAYVGHKEAVSQLPEHAVLLATGEAAPVQMFRIGGKQYATQFHPELDTAALMQRIRIYQHHGYFKPEEMDDLLDRVSATSTPEANRLLRAFVDVFTRPAERAAHTS